MSKETKCIVTGLIGSVGTGALIGIVTRNTVLPMCDNVAEKALVMIGASAIGFTAGGVFGDQWFEFCDDVFGTEFKSKDNEED